MTELTSVSVEGLEILNVSVASSHACHQSNSCHRAQLTWDARKSKVACLSCYPTHTRTERTRCTTRTAMHIPDPWCEALVRLNCGAAVPLHFTHQTDYISHCMSPTGLERKNRPAYITAINKSTFQHRRVKRCPISCDECRANGILWDIFCHIVCCWTVTVHVIL